MPDLNLLEVNDLTVRFRNQTGVITAVDGISFQIGRQEILGIVGESGSGKSVTALSLLRLIPSPPATILASGILFKPPGEPMVDLTRLTEPQLNTIRGKDISMIFQEPMTSLNPVLTCGSQVLETIRQHRMISSKEATREVLELFSEVRLPDPPRIFSAYPHELSGGQKQRVMIAMAVSCNPALLIADEPTTALDASVQQTILDLLKRLQQKRNMSILFITHDLGLISRFADRVLVMYRGKIVEEGIVEEMFTQPRHPYTKGLIACRPDPGKRLKRLPTIEDFLSTANGISGKPEFEEEVISSQEREDVHRRLYAGEPVLRVEAVEKVFSSKKAWLGKATHSQRAVDRVSFSIYPGETLGIVGESGCGKTTLSRVILQLIPADAGKIFFGREEITSLSQLQFKKLRKDLQIIFQDPYSSLNPRIPVGRAILEPLKVHGLYGDDRKRKTRVSELLEMVGLDPQQSGRYPHEFSGGQRQRICIARALAVEPRLIICDESVSALDVSIQAQILNLLNQLKETLQLTYIFISHDLQVVRYMSDRILVMNQGKIVSEESL